MAWLDELPKVELHLHLEGSMSPATVRSLVDRHGDDMTWVWPDGVPEHFTFDDFPHFGRQYIAGLSLLKTSDDIATVTDDLAAALAAQRVRYAEITTTAFTHFAGGTTAADYSAGLDEGRRRAAARGVEIGWVVDIPRDLERPDSTATIDFLEGAAAPAGVVAIGLGGYEVGFPAADWVDQFARARAIGLPAVPHAGETEGAASITAAIADLGAVRIGHGVRCLEDPDLVHRIVDEGIFLEVCPTSNLLLGVVDRIEDHPLPALLEAGIRLCVNTDDPGWFDTTLTRELTIASELLGVSKADHVRLQRDALAASYAPDDVRHRITTELTALPER